MLPRTEYLDALRAAQEAGRWGREVEITPEWSIFHILELRQLRVPTA